MIRRIYIPWRIINKLMKAEVLLIQGSTIGEAASKKKLQNRPTIDDEENTVI